MNINVKYFASMREHMGRSEQCVPVDQQSLTVAELWDQYLSSEPMPDNILIAVNMDYSDASRVLAEGDEVAFFPPVTGG